VAKTDMKLVPPSLANLAPDDRRRAPPTLQWRRPIRRHASMVMLLKFSRARES
jgi:hypothetical protein